MSPDERASDSMYVYVLAVADRIRWASYRRRRADEAEPAAGVGRGALHDVDVDNAERSAPSTMHGCV
jgi:hypothetical protein